MEQDYKAGGYSTVATGNTSIMIHVDAEINEKLRRMAFDNKTSKKKLVEDMVLYTLAKARGNEEAKND